MQDNNHQVWKNLWKIKSIPKHIHFSWRILHEKLPVKNDLFKRGISSDPLCVLCGEHNETISHLFMECHWSKQIWFASSLGVVFNSHDSMYVPFHKWLEENIIVHVLTLCYEIWRARNKKCFVGTNVNVAATVQNAQRSIVNFKSASTVLVETLSGGPILPISDVHWTPPSSGFYKLNVDAAGPLEGDKWGIGVVVRDNEGVVVGASS
jgi:hypothetical protein